MFTEIGREEDNENLKTGSPEENTVQGKLFITLTDFLVSGVMEFNTFCIVFVFFILKLKFWTFGIPIPDTNPGKPGWVKSKKFQGDITGYSSATFDALVNNINNWQSRRQQQKSSGSGVFDSAIKDPRGLWLNGVVPYVVASTDPQLELAVIKAIQALQETTCIKFIKRTTEENYIKIVGDQDGCHCDLGNRHAGGQILSLGDGCRVKGTAIHELMHGLGFWHEQQRIDRDDYVLVLQENIERDSWDQYDKANTSSMNLIGNYDMDSIMHYSSDAFALPNKLTMRAKNSSRTNFGGEELTKEDIRKIRLLYRCDLGSVSDITIEPSVKYFIKGESTDNCLSVHAVNRSNGVQLEQADCNKSPDQQWVFARVSPDVYTLYNVGNDKYMILRQSEVNKDVGTVEQYQDQPGGHDTWVEAQFKFEPRPDRVFHVSSVMNGHLIWADADGVIRHFKHDSDQNWRLKRVDTKIETYKPYYIRGESTDKCLTVPDESRQDGLNLLQLDCNGSPAQQWVFYWFNADEHAIRNIASDKFMAMKEVEINQEAGLVEQNNVDLQGRGRVFWKPAHFIFAPQGEYVYHISSVLNNHTIWVDPSGKVRHFKGHADKHWKLQSVDASTKPSTGLRESAIVPGVKYLIKPETMDNCLQIPTGSTVDNVNLWESNCNGSPDQQWLFTRLSPDVYNLQNVGTSKWVDLNPFEVTHDWGTVDQFAEKKGQFKFEPRPGDAFHVTCVANGHVVWATSGGVVQHYKHDGGQNWILQRAQT